MTFHLSFHIQCQSNSLKMISRKPCALILTSNPLKKDQQIRLKMISCVKNHPCQNKKFLKKFTYLNPFKDLNIHTMKAGLNLQAKKITMGWQNPKFYHRGQAVVVVVLSWWDFCGYKYIFLSLVRNKHQWHLLTWPCVIGPHLGFSHSFQWGPYP